MRGLGHRIRRRHTDIFGESALIRHAEHAKIGAAGARIGAPIARRVDHDLAADQGCLDADSDAIDHARAIRPTDRRQLNSRIRADRNPHIATIKRRRVKGHADLARGRLGGRHLQHLHIGGTADFVQYDRQHGLASFEFRFAFFAEGLNAFACVKRFLREPSNCARLVFHLGL